MKYKIFSHTDLDGIGCAILAYLAFGRENVDVEYCNYNDVNEKVEAFIEEVDLFNSYDKVFITDISVSESVANMIDILDKLYGKVLLLDHHATATYLNAYDWCQVLVEMPVTHIKTSGTELFYHHLQRHEQFEQYDGVGANMFRNIDRFVEIVRDYDTWRWKELGEEGIVCKQMNDLFDIYGREKFINWAMYRIYAYREPMEVNYLGSESFLVLESEMTSFPWFSDMDRALLDQKQKDIDIYVEQKNKQVVESTDQFDNKFGVVFAERYFSELGNRLCELHPDLAYIAMIDISRGAVSYRTIRDDIDVGLSIAHGYGGGGHRRAAGSTFNKDTVINGILSNVFHIPDDDSGIL